MTPAQLDATFAALADPTRRAILARLTEGSASVNELAAPFAMSQPAISKHIKMLERAGLVTRSADGTRRPVRIEAAPMKDAVAWLEEFRKFWEASYGRLDALLLAPADPRQFRQAEFQEEGRPQCLSRSSSPPPATGRS